MLPARAAALLLSAGTCLSGCHRTLSAPAQAAPEPAQAAPEPAQTAPEPAPPAPEPAPPAPEPAQTAETGNFRVCEVDPATGACRPGNEDAIRRTIARYRSEIRRCYTEGLARDPALRGRVVLQMTLLESGRLDAVEATPATDLPDPATVACIVAAARTWRFPAHERGRVLITYPIVLESA